MSINRPLRLPGRRLVLTKNKILESHKHTKSNMEAARWLGVSYNTYRKWAIFYGVFEQHLNQKGFGVKKGWSKPKIPMEEIFAGRKVRYTFKQFKTRLIDEGYLNEECSICNWNEERVTDGMVCLTLDFIDGDSKNWAQNNIRLLCPNCYLSNNGFFHGSTKFCK